MIQKGDTIINARSGQRMTFLQTWAETNGALLQIDCYSPVSHKREHEHIHPYQENRFRILSGELWFCVNGEDRLLVPGEELAIPKNTPHYFWNSGAEEAHYIQEFAPALKIDALFETFFALARDNKLNSKGAPNILRTARIMLHFRNEIRLTKPGWGLQKFIYCLLSPLGKLLGYPSYYQ